MKVIGKDIDGIKVSLNISNSLYRVGMMFDDTKKADDGSLRGFDYYLFSETGYIERGLVHIASRYRELALYHNRCSDIHNVLSVRIDVNQLHKLKGYRKYDGMTWYQEVVNYIESISVNDNNSIDVRFTDSFTSDYMGYVLDANILRNRVEDVMHASEDIIPFDLCGEYAEWSQVLDNVLVVVTRLLSNAYRIYLDFMTRPDVSDALGDRYDGLIQSRYHSYLGDSLFVKTSVYVASGSIETLFVDPVMGYDIDGNDISYGTMDANYMNIRDVRSCDEITRLLDILEMMAYINDGIIDYLDTHYSVISNTRIVGLLYMPYNSDSCKVVDIFSNLVENGIYLSSYSEVTDGSSVCSVEDGFNTSWEFRFSLPVRLLSKKLMASRVSTANVWFDTYINMLHLYARDVFGVDISK